MKSISTLLVSMCALLTHAQIVPDASNYNADIAWEEVYTGGPSGKVNRGMVDSQGHCIAVSMPNNKARIVKANGANGQQMWAVTINSRVGFGVCEVEGDGHPDYIVSGGTGSSQERWLTRLNGLDGSVMWDRVYDYAGGGGQFDGLRTLALAQDGMIVASGFVQGDESDTIFVVYAGSAVVMKVDPSDGDVVWESVNGQSEYALATAQGPDGSLYSAGVMYDEGLSITKRTADGSVLWTEVLPGTVDVIPYDLAMGSGNDLYYGGHTPRSGAGEPFDYTCIRLNLEADVQWLKHYANPRGYSLSQIRNELYGIEVGSDGVYMFGGSGDESNYSATTPPLSFLGRVGGMGVGGGRRRRRREERRVQPRQRQLGHGIRGACGGWLRHFQRHRRGGRHGGWRDESAQRQQPCGGEFLPRRRGQRPLGGGGGHPRSARRVWMHVGMHSRRGWRRGGQRDRRPCRHFCVWERLPLSAFNLVQGQNQGCRGNAVLSIGLPVSTQSLMPPVTASR